MTKKVGRTTTMSAVAVRMAPRMRHLLDVIGRRHRRTMTAVIEHAIHNLATDEELQIWNSTWSTDEDERTLKLYQIAPHLCTYDEEVSAKAQLQNSESIRRQQIQTIVDDVCERQRNDS
ncbi:hypothetical protein [Pseudomonas sp. HTZ1]|uniref:hypothetical protein n=1 Tax=Pseudomonas sp. HTZ1 TaxID=3075219 RepID=UPI00287BCE7A|nr:hypothetical protein [Pseudomonas sp. HTZ1]MDS9590696.1 hypothetical protein [Pseudomonas sp. HTZ1]